LATPPSHVWKSSLFVGP